MLCYRDFKKTSKMLGLSSGPFETSVAAANEWIGTNKIVVINVETLTDTGGIGGISSTSQDGIRVWYME